MKALLHTMSNKYKKVVKYENHLEYIWLGMTLS